MPHPQHGSVVGEQSLCCCVAVIQLPHPRGGSISVLVKPSLGGAVAWLFISCPTQKWLHFSTRLRISVKSCCLAVKELPRPTPEVAVLQLWLK